MLTVCFSYIQPPEMAAKWNRCNELRFFFNVTMATCCFCCCKMQFLWIFSSVLLTHKLLPRAILLPFHNVHQYLIKELSGYAMYSHVTYYFYFLLCQIFHFLFNFLELSFAWFRTLHNSNGNSVLIMNTMLWFSFSNLTDPHFINLYFYVFYCWFS